MDTKTLFQENLLQDLGIRSSGSKKKSLFDEQDFPMAFEYEVNAHYSGERGFGIINSLDKLKSFSLLHLERMAENLTEPEELTFDDVFKYISDGLTYDEYKEILKATPEAVLQHLTYRKASLLGLTSMAKRQYESMQFQNEATRFHINLIKKALEDKDGDMAVKLLFNNVFHGSVETYFTSRTIKCGIEEL